MTVLSERNAAKTHCVNGHEFTPENTRIVQNARRCMTCHRARLRAASRARRPQLALPSVSTFMSPEPMVVKLKRLIVIDTASGCWTVPKSKLMAGRRKLSVQRTAYKEFVGPLRDNRIVLSACGNPLCVSPLHLRLKRNDETRGARKLVVRDYVNALKAEPCMDCGGRFPPECMDFDHRDRATKKAAVSKLVDKCRPLATIEEEIAKCDLVCSNCHRIRTVSRGDHRQVGTG